MVVDTFVTNGEMMYTEKPADGSEPVFAGLTPGKQPLMDKHTAKFVGWDLPVHDMRKKDPASLSLDHCGFLYRKCPEVMLKDDEWEDMSMIEEHIVPQVTELVKELCDAEVVVNAFNSLRNAAASEGDAGAQKPSWGVHIDVTDEGARWASKISMKQKGWTEEEVDELWKKRVRMIQVWRPIRHTVYDAPLAFIDWTSLDTKEDLIASSILYPSGHVLKAYSVCGSKKHSWWIVNEQKPDELVFFKGWDTQEGVPRYIPHTAFKHPEFFGRCAEVSKERGIEIKPRESLEMRFWCFG